MSTSFDDDGSELGKRDALAREEERPWVVSLRRAPSLKSRKKRLIRGSTERLLMRLSVVGVVAIIAGCVWMLIDPPSREKEIRQRYQREFERHPDPERRAVLKEMMEEELDELYGGKTAREVSNRPGPEEAVSRPPR
jgi:hypothetical protein